MILTDEPVRPLGVLDADQNTPGKVCKGARNAPAGDPLAVALLTRFDASIVDQTVERAAILEHDAGLPRTAAEAAVCDLYVATDLSSWLAPVIAELGRTGYAAVVTSDGQDYRKLDAAWYGYLRQQMTKAKALAAQGRIPDADWQTLRIRFAEIHRFAVVKLASPTPPPEGSL